MALAGALKLRADLCMVSGLPTVNKRQSLPYNILSYKRGFSRNQSLLNSHSLVDIAFIICPGILVLAKSTMPKVNKILASRKCHRCRYDKQKVSGGRLSYCCYYAETNDAVSA